MKFFINFRSKIELLINRQKLKKKGKFINNAEYIKFTKIVTNSTKCRLDNQDILIPVPVI